MTIKGAGLQYSHGLQEWIDKSPELQSQTGIGKGIGEETTIAEQHEEIDRRIIELLDSILDVSIDSTKGQIIYMVKNLRDSLERRKENK